MEDLSSDTALAPTLVSSDGPGSSPAPEAKATTIRGQSIGRYLLLEELGAGAMGIVYAAYDPELDRKIALKLLKHRGGKFSARQRFQREAQALARLDHPNVVRVHDVGVHGEDLFIAMEYVDGQTLGGWMAEADLAPTPTGRRLGGDTKLRARPWREVLGVFDQAGRGLAAAHAVGLVHRDFKPKSRFTSPERP